MATMTRTLPNRAIRAVFVWPVKVLWKLTTFAANAMGILLTLILGVALIAAGVLLSSTVVGLVVGIPLLILGTLLLARALY